MDKGKSSEFKQYYPKTLGDNYNIDSAGTEAHGVNANAITTLLEIGIDISNNQSKSIIFIFCYW